VLTDENEHATRLAVKHKAKGDGKRLGATAPRALVRSPLEIMLLRVERLLLGMPINVLSFGTGSRAGTPSAPSLGSAASPATHHLKHEGAQ
jgi:hypothetical protein